MSEARTVSWASLTSYRAEAVMRLGTLHDLPIIDISAELNRLLWQASAVLDVGAGTEQPLRQRIDATRTTYATLDPDPPASSISAHSRDIPANMRFDLAVANQVLEHVSVYEAVEIVRVWRRRCYLADSSQPPSPTPPIRYASGRMRRT